MMTDSKIRLGDISVNFLQQMDLTVTKLGYDIEPVLAKYNVSIAHLAAHNGRISIPKYMRIGFDLMQLTGHSDLGLLLGRDIGFQHYGILGFACMSASNITEMAKDLARYETLLSRNIRGRSQFLEKPDYVLKFYSIAPYNQYNYFVVDSVLAGWYTLLQSRAEHITERHATTLIKEVHIEYPAPTNAATYRNYFHCPVIFNADFNGLVFHPQVMSVPLPDACSASYLQAQHLCQTELVRLAQNQDWQTKVTEKISHNLVGKMPDINHIAELLGTSVWTLRRRLYREETNYQRIMDNTRKGLALSYVRETQITFSEISYLLGFATPAAFYKAFKRWVTTTPKNYRQSFLNNKL
jgi:AraC-like DNA-binding protein